MKILVLDIETAPHLVYSWGLWNQNIPIARLVKPGYTMCWSAKFVGSQEGFSSDIFTHDAKTMLSYIHHLLSEADGVVTYNGDRFDLPQLNRGFVEIGLPRPAAYKKVDLYKTVKKNFKFASNKLTYVCDALGLDNKTPHKGMELWTGCMNGDPESWKQMLEYNQQDVVITEQLYHTLLPWIDGHPNFVLHQDVKDVLRCPKCGSKHIHRRGLQHSATQSYHRYQCQDCKSWFRERFTSVEPEDRKLILAESK